MSSTLKNREKKKIDIMALFSNHLYTLTLIAFSEIKKCQL